MKTKKMVTKLELNRNTVANLNEGQMDTAKGGAPITFFNCPTGPMYTPCCP